jgi:hypothetical protein
MQARRKLVSSLSGVAWMVRSLMLLSSCSAWKRAKLTWTWSLPSRETAREEVFWSLAVLAVVLLMRRLLMRVFSAGLRSSFHLWAEAGPLKGPRSRWTGIPGIQNTDKYFAENYVLLKDEPLYFHRCRVYFPLSPCVHPGINNFLNFFTVRQVFVFLETKCVLLRLSRVF